MREVPEDMDGKRKGVSERVDIENGRGKGVDKLTRH